MKRALAERANKTADAMSSSSYPPVPLHVAPSSFSDKNSTHSSFGGSEKKNNVHVDSQSYVNNHKDANQQNLYSTAITKRQRPHAHGPQSASGDGNTNSEIDNKHQIDAQQVSSMSSNFRQSSLQTQPLPVSSSLNNSLSQNQSVSPPRQRRKRKKEEVSSEEDEEEQSSKAYFLKFQNKALASELYMLKHQVQKYQKIEKDWKNTGKEIEKGILTMEQKWRKSVASLCGVLYSIGFLLDRNGDEKLSQKHSHKIEHEDHVDRETPSSLLHSIQRVISGLQTNIPGPDSDTQPSPPHAPQQISFEHNNIGVDKGDGIDLANVQDLIDKVNTMSDQAEVVIRDGLLKWINIIALPRLNGSNSSKKNVMNIAQLYQQLSIYRQNIDAFQDKVAELTKEKQDALQAEKRVRRGLYRIAAGRLKIEDVMKDVENEDNGMPPLHDSDVAVKPDPDSSMPTEVVSSASQNDVDDSKSPMKNDEKLSKAAVSAEMTQKLQELESVCEVRNNRIQELLNEKENLEKRINKLISEPGTSQISIDAESLAPEIIQQTDTYTTVSAKLASAEHTILNLTNSMKDIQERWGISKGECEHMKKIIDDLNEKHAKRWKNLTGNSIDDKKETCDDNDTTTNNDKSQIYAEGTNDAKDEELTFSKERTLLEHKLQQALEGMRQVEGLRLALAEATKMNDCLQSQVSEWKSKYTTLSTNKSSSRSSSSSQKQSSSSSSSSKSETAMERIKLDFRKCRKELMAEKLARENYKTKNERLEKERDSMMRTNVRLIKQSSEKEEMNTKSLSSILQLNHLSELHAQQIETLEQKLKAVEQVALAARLTSNAKARFEEELKKENKSLEEKIEKLNTELNKVQSEKFKTEALLNQSKRQLQASVKDLDVIRKRCDELAGESTATVKEKTKLMESLAVVKKSAQNSFERTNSMGKSYSSNGSFTVDQLNTHLSVLKRRLSCQVCNERDKECILLRCRHMFCKQCVEKNIKNRSRKCPACGQRFDTKDVGDIWL